jgi:hypothetical protein
MSTVTASVSAATASSSAVLSFAFVPLSVVAGMTIVDNTTSGALSANAMVLSINRLVAPQTVTMNFNAVGAGVGATDSITFTASDTIDNNTLYASVISQAFQNRVFLLCVSWAITILAGSPPAAELAFCGALLSGRVSQQLLTQLVLIPTGPNRAQCLLDATTPGGQITDANLTTEIGNTLSLLSISRNWN